MWTYPAMATVRYYRKPNAAWAARRQRVIGTTGREGTEFWSAPASTPTRTSGIGPRLPTCALQQVGSYLGYTGRDANILGNAGADPGCVKTRFPEIP
jgi:hypothetical protein